MNVSSPEWASFPRGLRPLSAALRSAFGLDIKLPIDFARLLGKIR